MSILHNLEELGYKVKRYQIDRLSIEKMRLWLKMEINKENLMSREKSSRVERRCQFIVD